MDTLFRVKFNWGFYFLALVVIKVLWFDVSWIGFVAIAISLHQFLLLFFSVGSVIPIRYLAGSFMCLQMLLGPTFAYNGLDAYAPITYQMRIPEAVYFGYALPAVSLFIIGLHVTAAQLKGEVLNVKEISKFVESSGNLPYIFVAVGFLSSFVAGFFGAELAFVFYLLGSFKYIGGFMIILSPKQEKLWITILIFSTIIGSSLRNAMFHDLLTWMIMLGAVLAIKIKPSLLLKTITAAAFILMAVVIQQVKSDYRKSAWGGAGSGAGWASFESAIREKSEEDALFSFESLAKSNIRINQGFIVTNIMNNIPNNLPFEEGKELWIIIKSALLPRILAPDKLNAGDRLFFMKYSGMALQQGTSMGLSSMGDFYINFGVLGGCICMFLYGLLFSTVLNGFENFSKIYPFILLFTPLVFYYPIRPDCELQTSLGHLVKASFLIYMMLLFWRKDLSKIAEKKKPAIAKNQAIPVSNY